LHWVAELIVSSSNMHVPGAKAHVDAAPVMPGLKSRPILKTRFFAASEVPAYLKAEFSAHSEALRAGEMFGGEGAGGGEVELG
jgi:hypothetical protein